MLRIGLFVALGAMLSLGCASPRSGMSDYGLLLHEYQRVEQVRRERAQLLETLVARVQLEHARPNHTPTDPTTLDVLVISGGGAYGAFGAGFIYAWGNEARAADAMPEFDIVTGVSTGALIAPFAFLNGRNVHPCACHGGALDKGDSEHVLGIYNGLGPRFAAFRGITALLPWSDGMYDTSRLRSKIESEMCTHLLDRLAAGHREHRTLLVGATDADLAQIRIWNLSEIASTEAPAAERTRRIRDVLLASAAIPAAFNAVEIDQHLYVDGGAREQLFLGADPAFVRELHARLLVQGIPFPRVRLWVVVNNKLALDPRITSRGWVDVARRSIENLVNSSTLFSLRDLYYFCEYANSVCPDYDFEMRFVCIPDYYTVEESDDLFDPRMIGNLTRLGLKLGAAPDVWCTEPPGLLTNKESDRCPGQPSGLAGAAP